MDDLVDAGIARLWDRPKATTNGMLWPTRIERWPVVLDGWG